MALGGALAPVKRSTDLGGSWLQPRVEIANALNAKTIHTTVTRYGPAWDQVRDVRAPRVIRLAAQVEC